MHPHHVTELAKLMRKHTEQEKLETFESIETEVRDQIQKIVAPKIGEFFSDGGEKCSGKTRKVKSLLGEVKIKY